MLRHLGLGGFQMTDDPVEATVIIVNTCSFIDAAKQESIDTILDLADYKDSTKGKCEARVVAGCMAQRYAFELEKDLPVLDLIIGIGEYTNRASFSCPSRRSFKQNHMLKFHALFILNMIRV